MMLPTFITETNTTIKSRAIALDMGGTRLMSFVATVLKQFLAKYNLLDNNLPLGFTFSFPCHHNTNSITSASLVAWTKEFSVGFFSIMN